MSINLFTNWFNKSLNKSPSTGTFGKLNNQLGFNISPAFNKKITSPLDLSAGTLSGATLNQNTQSALNAKINVPTDPLLSQNSNTTTGSNQIKSNFFSANEKNLNTAADITGVVGGIFKPLDHVSAASNVLNIGGDIAGMIPGPYGAAAKTLLKGVALVDQLTGKKANSQVTAGQTATGYNLEFNANANTSYGGLFGNKARKNANRLTARQDYSNIGKINASNESNSNMLASSNSMQDVYAKNFQQRQGGISNRILTASKGTKLSLSKIVQKVTANLGTPKETKMNVIPSGALHARKHDLPEEIAEQVTNKGIPVVTFDDNGKIIQHCEIEREELTLHKQLTVKLEDLLSQYNDANDDEKEKILIKTGKLLTYEILENTQDNVDLINKIE